MPASRLVLLVHEGAWVAAGQGLGAVGSVAVALILAHWIHVEDYGLFSLAMTAAAVGQSVVFGPWAVAAMRFDAVATAEGGESDFLRTVVRGQAALTLAAAALGACASAGVGWWSGGRAAGLTAAAVAAVIATAWVFLAGALQTARRRRVAAALHQGATPWLRLLLAGAAIAVLGPTALAAMVGWALGSALIAISQWAWVPRPGAAPLVDGSPRIARRMAAFATPFAIWGIFACAQAASDRWALTCWADLHAVGTYFMAYQLGFAPAQLLGYVVETLVVPVTYAMAGAASDPARVASAHRRIKVSALALMLCALLGAGALAIGAPLIARLLPASYAQAVAWIAPMFLAGGLTAASQVLSLILMVNLEPRGALLPKIGGALLAVALIVAGAARAGVRGVVWAQVATAVVALLWMGALSLRRAADRAAP